MNIVYSITEAMEWFLENRDKSVTCSKDGRRKECRTFIEAKEFFKS